MMEYYILDGQTVVPVDDVLVWGRWFEKANRSVARDVYGDATVSTVFLGINHSFETVGPPLLFETMVFGGALDNAQERCSTWEEAVDQHNKVLSEVKKNERS